MSKKEKELIEKHQISANSLSGNDPPVRSQQCMLISMNSLGNVRWREGIEIGEDSIFLREYALNKHSYYEIDDVIYYYRQQPDSAIHKTNNIVRRMQSHVAGAKIMKHIYDSPNGKCEANANYLMMFVIYALYLISQNPSKESNKALASLKNAKLFPFKKPKECTKMRSFIVTRNDLKGRLLDAIIMNAGNYFGFSILRVIGLIRH